MTEKQITDRMAQMIRIGFVNARQPEKMRVKVTIPDTTGAELVTDFLPVLCPRACEDMQYDLPDVGDQVLCLFLSYGLEQGFVLGAMYGKQTPPVQSGDKWHRKFKDGTYLEYDREQHKLVADVKGDVEITTTGSISGNIQQDLSAQVQGSMTASSQGPAQIASQSQLSIDSPSMNMGGGGGGATSASMQGTFRLTQGDIIAESVSLRHHVHICPACGAETSPPVSEDGGSSGGGGTGSGNGDSGGDSEESGDGQSGNSGEDETSGGEKDTSDNSSQELSPEMAVALAETGFSWTEENKEKYEETKKKVHLQDNEVFDTILCLPTIAEAEARRASGDNRLGWLYLKQMFEKWLAGKNNADPFANGEPFWVSMDWVLSYLRARAVWEYVKLKFRLFIDEAEELLFQRIKDAGLLTGKKENFNFTNLQWPLWNANYFRRIDVPGMSAFPPDGLMAAMGDFNFRFLADGFVEPNGTSLKIEVTKVAGFVWDSFNFDGEQAMEYWSCVHEKFQGLDPDEAVYLRNSDFRLFQDEIKSGSDFLVLSIPKQIDNFERHVYEIKI